MTDSITLIDAAERLGVHYMTAYRYVRTGRLAAHKVDGQWQVDESDLATFEQSPKTTGPRKEVLPALIEERLIAGDENGTYQLIDNAMASGADADEVYLDLISPAMVSIGARWSKGEITIADEHIASSTVLRVISRLGPRVSSRGRTRGTILLASVSDDYHYLPTAMLRDLLRFRGFGVQDLGANTPSQTILDRARTVPDLLAIGLSATSSGHEDVMAETLATLSVLDVPMVVGGSAFTSEEQIRALGECIRSTSSRGALSIFDDIHTRARSKGR